jgi:hypothetical protein
MSGQLHAPTHLLSGKEPPVPVREEAGMGATASADAEEQNL